MRLAFILVTTFFNKFLSVMFVNKLENLSGSCRMMLSWLMENPYNCSFKREVVHFSSQLRWINQPRNSATKRVPKQDGFEQNYYAFEWNHCIDIFRGFVYLDQASHVLDVSDINAVWKMLLWALQREKEEIQFKANGEFAFFF